jgi:membrane fusion protein, macrolide-specific efflux system
MTAPNSFPRRTLSSSRTLGSSEILRFFRSLTLTLTLLLLTLTACTPGTDSGIPTFIPPSPQPTSLPRIGDRPTARVTRGTITSVVEAPGRVESLHTEELYFGTTGTVRTVFKEPGAQVVAGERIAELDAYTLERDVLQRASELLIAELNLSLVESRTAGQSRSDGQDLSQITPATIELAIARERVALAVQLHELARAQLDEAVVMAPFTGTLTSFTRQRGSRASAYETVGIVADLSNVRIVAWVPVDALEGIVVGSMAGVELVQQSSALYRAIVTRIADKAAVQEGIWAYELELAWAPGEAATSLPPTLPLEVKLRIDGETREDTLLVLTSAVTTFAGQSFVDIMLPDGTLQNVPVQTGLANATQIAILDGVEEGQIVVLP